MAVSKEFVLSGKAIFTCELPDGSHYTYKVAKKEASEKFPKPVYWAFLLTGPNNQDDYTYLGTLRDYEGQVSSTAKSKVSQDTLSFKLLNRLLARVWTNDHEAYEQHGYKLHHEGQCGKCGNPLTTPESVQRGIGPKCWKKLGY